MKRTLAKILGLIMAATVCATVASVEVKAAVCDHNNWGSGWEADGSHGHFHRCQTEGCEGTSQNESHIFNSDSTCTVCSYTCPSHIESEWKQGYGDNGNKHIKDCTICGKVLASHTYGSTAEGKECGEWYDCDAGVADCTKQWDVVHGGMVEWVTEKCSETGRTYKVQKCKKCGKYYWDSQTFIEEKKEKKKESSSSSSSSSSAPVLTAAQQAKVTQDAQATVGSTAYATKQAEVQKSVTTAVASLATLTPAQVKSVSNTGFAVNLGGCTTLDKTTVATLASNNKIPYNMGFTWNGINFIVKVPTGADYTKLIDAQGNLQMWKLVQKYGIAGASLVK